MNKIRKNDDIIILELKNKKKDELKSYLYQNGIGTLIQWGGLGVHQFTQLGFNITLPKTEIFFQNCIMLPMNIFISNDDVDYICQKVIQFYRS